MAKKMTIALIVLIDLCTSLSLLQVRSGAFSPATLWNAAEVNLLHVRSRAVQYFEGIRLIYDIARQLQRLQEEAIHDCSMRSTFSNKAATENWYRDSRIYRDGRSVALYECPSAQACRND